MSLCQKKKRKRMDYFSAGGTGVKVDKVVERKKKIVDNSTSGIVEIRVFCPHILGINFLPKMCGVLMINLL